MSPLQTGFRAATRNRTPKGLPVARVTPSHLPGRSCARAGVSQARSEISRRHHRRIHSRRAEALECDAHPIPGRKPQCREERPEPYRLSKRRSVSTVLGLPMLIRRTLSGKGRPREPGRRDPPDYRALAATRTLRVQCAPEYRARFRRRYRYRADAAAHCRAALHSAT